MDKRSIIAGILFGLIGLAVNCFNYSLFFGVDFVFGSAFAMFALLRFGTFAGITAGFISSIGTYLIWSHPWAIIIFTAESIAVAALFRKKKYDILSWDILYWLTCGSLLVWIFYHIVLGLSEDFTLLINLKQALNGVLCTVVAQALNLLFINISRDNDNRPTFQNYTFTVMIVLVITPTIALRMLDIREQLQRRYDIAVEEILHADELTRNMVSRWISEQQNTISALSLFVGNPENTPIKDIQRYTELFLNSSGFFKRMGVMNSQAISIAYSPEKDEFGKSNIGKDFSDRPYMSAITQIDKPYIGDVLMGRIGNPIPIVPLISPIFRDGVFKGFCGGIIELDHLKKILQEIVFKENVSLTLTDRNEKIICSTKQNVKIMESFARTEGESAEFQNGIKQWIPQKMKGVNNLERWRGSYYFTESLISDSIPWKIITEFPVDPILNVLTKTTNQGFAFMAALVILTTILSHIVSRWLGNSLTDLQKTVDMIPQNIETITDILWPSSHIFETDNLSKKFEQMVEKQKKYITEINDLNRNLESRVEQRTRELQDATNEINTYFTVSPDLFCIADSNGFFRKLNKAWEDSLGYSLSELENHRYFEFVHHDDIIDTDKTTDFAAENPVANFSNRYIKKDGSICWLEWRSIPIGDKIYAAARDVSKRMIMEENLRQSEEKYKSILSAMHEGVIMRSASGEITACNHKAMDILGLTEKEILGHKFSNPEWTTISLDGKSFSEEDHPALITLKTGSPITGSIMGLQKPGQATVWLMVNSEPIHDKDSKTVTAVVSTFSDITNIKNAEETIKKNESLFRSIFEQAAVGVSILDAESGRFLRINKRYSEILGYTEEEIADKSILDITHPDDSLKIRRRLNELKQNNLSILSMEKRHIRKDGSQVWVNISMSPVILQGKIPDMLVAVAQDITAIKEAEESLYDINKTLEQRVATETKSRMENERMLIQQSKMAAMGEMIGAIAHQWRQPLNAISAIIQDIRHAEESGCLDGKYIDIAVNEAMQQIRFMSKTIDDFRNFFKTDKIKSKFGVKKAISQVYSMLSNQLKNLNIEWITFCHIHDNSFASDNGLSELEDHYIHGYENEFKQVFLNLIDNAKDAIVQNIKNGHDNTHKNSIKVELYSDNDKMFITVSDTGGGIPESILNRIFDPYFTTKEQGSGTGIGLYMSKMIIERNMSGTLTAANKGQGAEFRIELCS